MNKKYRVTLGAEERTQLQALTTSGSMHVRALKRAQMLLKATNVWTDPSGAIPPSAKHSTSIP